MRFAVVAAAWACEGCRSVGGAEAAAWEPPVRFVDEQRRDSCRLRFTKRRD